MDTRNPISLSRHRRWIIAPLLVLTLLGGCGKLAAVKDQADRIDSAGTIAGHVITEPASGKDTIVAILRRLDDASVALYRAAPTTESGAFAVAVPPGEYYVAAFIDKSGDGRHQPDEPGSLFGAPEIVKVAAQQKTSLTIRIDADSRPTLDGVAVDRTPDIATRSGVVAGFDDPSFDPANYSLGLWRPLDFLAGPGGGLYMLGEYQPDRVPVIFVHGMGDGPRRWRPAAESLDRARFQPWVLYYPTGLRLETVSNYFAGAVHELRRRYGFTQFAVVAHSMGGLVTRSFVQRLAAHFPDDAQALRLVLTVNSPQGGMPSATAGVEYSPVVIPSWQDVAAGSDFLAALDTRGWPQGIPYHLVFSYDGDQNGDGTVGLRSQIPPQLQSEATRIWGFQGTHVGTLSEPRFLALMNRLLAEATTAPVHAPAGAWFDEWVGDWTGPEGTSLKLAKAGDGYSVTIRSLDGTATYGGKVVRDHIEFRRGSRTESLHATGGRDTGMKWLLDKQRCLTVRTGEAYCRD